MVLGNEWEVFGWYTERDNPEKPNVGMEILNGRVKVTRALKIARTIPNGTHINMATVAKEVGLKASLPSWKISGFGYLSLGSCCQLLLSVLLTA